MEAKVGVSVILSTYNRCHYLPDALRALSEQDCRASYEVIVVDNASTDNTGAVIQQWCRTDARFRTVRESRLGLSWGKNAGIQLARAALLLFTDDDMIADRRWIQAYLEFFARQKSPRILAGGPYIPIPHDLGGWPYWFQDPALADLALLNYREERVLKESEWVWGGNMAVPAHLFSEFGLWDVTVGRRGDHRGTFEDTEFQDRIRKTGGVVWFCPQASVHHRVHRQTITPRQVTAVAFTRGRNDIWTLQPLLRVNTKAAPKNNAAEALLALAIHLFWWTFWIIAFRLFRKNSCFERARRAAFASGRSLDRLRPGRDSLRLFEAAGRVVFPVRKILLCLTPDSP